MQPPSSKKPMSKLEKLILGASVAFGLTAIPYQGRALYRDYCDMLVQEIAHVDQEIARLKHEVQQTESDVASYKIYHDLLHEYAGLDAPATQAMRSYHDRMSVLIDTLSLQHPQRFTRESTQLKQEMAATVQAYEVKAQPIIERLKTMSESLEKHGIFHRMRLHAIANSK